MRVSLRNIDLVIAGALIALATALSRLHDPALAIAVLGLAIAGALLCIGEETLEALWREYCREPERAPPREQRVERFGPPRQRVPRRRRDPKLAPARVVRAGERVFVSKAY